MFRNTNGQLQFGFQKIENYEGHQGPVIIDVIKCK